MESELVSISGLLLVFVLGLRHGLDPDHIAMIDSMTYHSLEQRPQLAPWAGTLFALGHGFAVTLIAVAVSSIANNVTIPDTLAGALEWFPIALLILIGVLNLRGLLSQSPYSLAGWKSRFIPRFLRDSSHPLAIFIGGVLFALVFDTATQAAAWGYVAAAHSGIYMALCIGLVFTFGMVITDTLDGRLMVRMLRRLSGRNEAYRYRRAIGWVVVVLSFSIALYSIVKRLFPQIQLSDTAITAIGLMLFIMLLAGYLWLARRNATEI